MVLNDLRVCGRHGWGPRVLVGHAPRWGLLAALCTVSCSVPCFVIGSSLFCASDALSPSGVFAAFFFFVLSLLRLLLVLYKVVVLLFFCVLLGSIRLCLFSRRLVRISEQNPLRATTAIISAMELPLVFFREMLPIWRVIGRRRPHMFEYRG